MRLVYDNVTRSTRNSPGVMTRVPGFGSTSTVEWLDPSHRYPTSYFFDIVEAMVTSSLGYVRDSTIRGAPFDFRKAPSRTSWFLSYTFLLCKTYEYNWLLYSFCIICHREKKWATLNTNLYLHKHCVNRWTTRLLWGSEAPDGGNVQIIRAACCVYAA